MDYKSGGGSEPGEVKHFSTQRKRKKCCRKAINIPLVVASEKG